MAETIIGMLSRPAIRKPGPVTRQREDEPEPDQGRQTEGRGDPAFDVLTDPVTKKRTDEPDEADPGFGSMHRWL